jgi:uncharacterized protein YxeA
MMKRARKKINRLNHWHNSILGIIIIIIVLLLFRNRSVTNDKTNAFIKKKWHRKSQTRITLDISIAIDSSIQAELQISE